MSTTTAPVIRRPRAVAGEFEIRKNVAGVRRVLVFVTRDGYEGVSRRFDREEAYQNAIAQRTHGQFLAVAHAPKPAPTVQMLHQLDESTLFRELERRGWAAVPAETVGIDAKGEPLPEARR